MLKTQQPRQRDKGYLGALHELRCLRCGAPPPIEAAHIRMTNVEWGQRAGVRTGAGMGEKPSDCWTLPLCAACHRTGPTAEHKIGTIRFYREWGVDPHAIAYALFTAYPSIAAMNCVAADVLFFGKYRNK